jgi:hypothetical protein
MATKKTPAAKKAKMTAAAKAPREFKGEAEAGKAKAGVAYNPAGALSRDAMAMPEPMEPRPKTTTRYPISNEAFEALKVAAPKARLAATSAVPSKDVKKRGDAPQAVEAMAPGNEPAAAPVASNNFAGISATGWLPPDCTMAVGPAHVLASVNSSVAVYTKAGAPQLQRTLTQWFANVASGMTIFDPKTLFDQHAGRWVLLAVAITNNPKASLHLLSISTTSDPMGPWRNYRFDAMRNGNTPTNNWADFPALGVDNQALYVTSNMFAFGGGFQYSKIRVIPKAGPYAGGAAPFFDFTGMKNADNTVAFTIQPSHTFGAPQVEYLANTGFPSANYLTVWRIVNPTTAPVLTRTQVAVSPYSLAPNAVQPGGAALLNTGDVRVLHAVFRGDSLWTSFTTAHNWGAGANRAAIQWCQIRAAVPAVVQQGVFGASTADYFYPAVCPDANGNVTVVFSRSSTSQFGSIAYTGRRATDPLGTLQGSAVLKAGVASYVGLDSGGRNRWGDYNGIASDPANGRVVWMYGEYASAVNTWGTWVGSAFF